VYPLYAASAGCRFGSAKFGTLVGCIPFLVHLVIVITYLTFRIFAEFSFYLLPRLVLNTILALIIFGGFSASVGYFSGKILPVESVC